MIVMNCLSVENKKLAIGGVKISTLVRKYGTPLLIMDDSQIRSNIREYKTTLNEVYPGESDVVYACKAFCCKAMFKILSEEEICADVCSGGELYTSVLGSFPGAKVYFNGNNKSIEEMELAFEHGIYAFVVDNISELRKLDMIAGEVSRKANILIRVRPGVEAHTHEFIQTGQEDSKFGVSLENGEAEKTFEYAQSLKWLNIIGIQTHIGSQIFDTKAYDVTVERLVDFVKLLKEKHGIELEEFDVGGGCGIKYTEKDTPVTISDFTSKIASKVSETFKKNKLPLPKLIIEPGRSIVGNAGITAYTVGSVKEIPNVRKYISIDGGMIDNPRYMLYGSEYAAIHLDKPTEKATETVTIAGKCCESGDVVIKDAKLPKVEEEDVIVVQCTGAYNYSMSSNYNRLPRPAVVMVTDGKDHIIIERETYEDIGRNDK